MLLDEKYCNRWLTALNNDAVSALFSSSLLQVSCDSFKSSIYPAAYMLLSHLHLLNLKAATEESG